VDDDGEALEVIQEGDKGKEQGSCEEDRVGHVGSEVGMSFRAGSVVLVLFLSCLFPSLLAFGESVLFLLIASIYLSIYLSRPTHGNSPLNSEI